MLKLHIVPPEGLPFDHPFQGDSLVVGRAADADLTLADPFLSRRHTRFYRVGSTLYVEDLGSRNGTLLNGQKVLEPSPVAVGDSIKISNSVLTLQEEAPPAPRVTQVDDFLEDGTIFRNAAEVLDRQRSADAAQAQGETGLRRYAERLKLLNEIHQALGQSLSLEGLLGLILERVLEHLRPDRGAILLKDASGELKPAAIRSTTGDVAEKPAPVVRATGTSTHGVLMPPWASPLLSRISCCSSALRTSMGGAAGAASPVLTQVCSASIAACTT